MAWGAATSSWPPLAGKNDLKSSPIKVDCSLRASLATMPASTSTILVEELSEGIRDPSDSSGSICAALSCTRMLPGCKSACIRLSLSSI
jgi:hypothetical protein